MTPRLFWYCIRYELSCGYLYMIFISLVCIIFFYILFDFLSDPRPPKIPCHQLCHLPLSSYSLTGILQYNQIISALNFLSFGIYTFLSLSISSSSSHHFLSLNIFTSAHFISSTAFTTLLSFTSDFLLLNLLQ